MMRWGGFRAGREGAVARRRLGFWRRVAVVSIVPTMTVWTRRNWSGMDNIPRDGGVILVANHLSEFDPLVVAHYVYSAGRWPQFLAKSTLFRNGVLGPLLRAVRQIPVYRGTADAVKSLEAAIAAVRAGDCVIIYPEGTTPKSGELWPQRGKTGIARLYLATGAPVVPLVTWGPQNVVDPRTEKLRLRPRTPVTVVAGPALDLSKWRDATPTAANLYAITDEIMTALRDMLAGIRAEPAPAQPSAAPNGGGP
jgi:1-acyl-sn-glycerol-3-phosphate acyltransferase